ncbi:hypothetical protein AADZ91_01515 [Colwelliaceae bacterium 6441]
MSVLCKMTVKQISDCNELLSKLLEEEKWQDVDATLKKRLTLLNNLVNQTDQYDDDDKKEIAHLYQSMLNTDNIFIKDALQQQEDIVEQLKKIKLAKKSLPAYQAFEK